MKCTLFPKYRAFVCCVICDLLYVGITRGTNKVPDFSKPSVTGLISLKLFASCTWNATKAKEVH